MTLNVFSETWCPETTNSNLYSDSNHLTIATILFIYLFTYFSVRSACMQLYVSNSITIRATGYVYNLPLFMDYCTAGHRPNALSLIIC